MLKGHSYGGCREGVTWRSKRVGYPLLENDKFSKKGRIGLRLPHFDIIETNVLLAVFVKKTIRALTVSSPESSAWPNDRGGRGRLAGAYRNTASRGKRCRLHFVSTIVGLRRFKLVRLQEET